MIHAHRGTCRSDAGHRPGMRIGGCPCLGFPLGMLRLALHDGLSLIELMVAVVILAVLVGVALPAFNDYSLRAYRSEAQSDLMACALALERWASVRFSYAGAADGDGDGIGDSDNGPVAAEVCTPGSVAEGRYAVLVTGDGNGFVLLARPSADGSMATDGFLRLDEAGNRAWDRDDDGEIGLGEEEWGS